MLQRKHMPNSEWWVLLPGREGGLHFYDIIFVGLLGSRDRVCVCVCVCVCTCAHVLLSSVEKERRLPDRMEGHCLLDRASAGAVPVGGDGGRTSWGNWQRNHRPAQVFRTSSLSSSQSVVSFLLN